MSILLESRKTDSYIHSNFPHCCYSIRFGPSKPLGFKYVKKIDVNDLQCRIHLLFKKQTDVRWFTVNEIFDAYPDCELLKGNYVWYISLLFQCMVQRKFLIQEDDRYKLREWTDIHRIDVYNSYHCSWTC